MKEKIKNLFADVRKIVAPGIVCMLLFTVVSCGTSNEPFELDEPGVYSRESLVFGVDNRGPSQIFPNDEWILRFFSRHAPPGTFIMPYHLVPINLPEEFQRCGLFVNVTYRRLEGDYMEIIEIEARVYSSRFIVRKDDVHGYLFYEDLGDDVPNVRKPINLPEEYRQDGLSVNATFHKIWKIINGTSIIAIEIISIMETPTRVETRITGGEEICITRVPWQVFLSDINRNNELICGGAIVAPNFILTARHCLFLDGALRPLNSIRVHAGTAYQSDIHIGNTFNVSRVIFHPNANVDVALLQLSSNIPFNDGMQKRPINFWSSSNTTLYNAGRRVHTSGWGHTEHAPWDVNDLRAVYLEIIPNQNVPHALSIRPHEMAATGTGSVRQGACDGDSGGALTTQLASGEHVHIGVVSRGFDGCGGTNQNSPSIFVRTSYILPWLATHIPRPTLSGPALICSVSAPVATFTIQNFQPGSIVTWTHSPNIQRVSSSGNTATFRQAHGPSGHGWVQPIVNGASLDRREVWVGTPFIERIVASSTHTSNIQRFEAVFPWIQWTTINRFTWWLDIGSGYNFVCGGRGPVAYIEFHFDGFFTLTVTATNACGEGSPQWLNIFNFGRSGMREEIIPQSNPISGAFHILLGYEEGARMQNTYDVRIYNSAGRHVRQVIAESGRVEFDLSDLPNGTYYLHICDGVEEPVIQPIVVENRG